MKALLRLSLPRSAAALGTKPGARGQVFLDAADDAGAEVKFHVEALLRKLVLGGVFVQHDHNLCHVIEFRDCIDILHGSAPLFVLCLVEQPSVSQHCEQRVNVAFASEVEPSADMAARG
uniref:Putative secreted protein n=1 Tax=Ixodes ricinus TaxID=34613 RepID=A0A6B0UM43_IXORI